jgi:hypothetical protein
MLHLHMEMTPKISSTRSQSALKTLIAFDEAVRKDSANQRRMAIEIPYQQADKDNACLAFSSVLKVLLLLQCCMLMRPFAGVAAYYYAKN